MLALLRAGLCAALLFWAAPVLAQSTINQSVPATQSDLTSLVVRNNFVAAASDINGLLAMHPSANTGACPSPALVGTDCLVTGASPAIWYKNYGAGWGEIGTFNLGTGVFTPGTACAVCALTNATNLFTSAQEINLNGSSLPVALTGTTLQTSNAPSTIDRFEADSYAAASHYTGVRFNGTVASPTVLVANNEIVSLNAFGYDAVSVGVPTGPWASFRCYAEDTWSSTLHGSYCDVAVTAGTASAAMAESVRFENDGGVTLPSTVTGGDKGAGTINAAGLFVNGVAVSTAVGAVNSFGNFSGDTTVTIAGTGSGPYTGSVTIKCTQGSASQVGCLEVGAGLSVSSAVVSVTNPSPSTSVSGDIVTFSNSTGALHDSGTLLTSLAPLASPTFTGTVTVASVLGNGRAVSGTTDTLSATDCGEEVIYTNSGTVTVTIPATLGPWCNVAILQAGSGKVLVNGSAVTPATLHSSHSYTGTSGQQWSVIGLNLEATGVAVLTGDGS